MKRTFVTIVLVGICAGLFWLFVGDRELAEASDESSTRSVKRFDLLDRSVVLDPISDEVKEEEINLVLPALDHDELLIQSKEKEKAGRHIFASARLVDITPYRDGEWVQVGEKAHWDFSIQSEGALSLNFGFREFYLPPGGELTLSDPTGASQPISFSAQDSDEHGELWTPLLETDRLLVSLSVPRQLASQVRLNLTKVNHGFRAAKRKSLAKAIGDSSSGSCNIDVTCDASDDTTFGPMIDLYRDQIRSVAAYTLGGIETCSGALINNTANDQRPYFLTANHCGITTANAASIVVYWNFENTVCRTPGSASSGSDGDGPITEFNSGSVLRSTRSASDFCLIELDDPVDASTSPFYAGWDRSGVNPTSAVGIHHPGVSEKRISFEFNPTTTTSAYLDATNSNGTHVRVSDWDFGTTEGGSSGSPLFDDQGRIIGQLEGGDAACGNNEADWYGRISRSWADGGDAASRLSDWLDPDGAQPLTIDGINSDELLTVSGGAVNESAGTLEVIVSLSQATNEEVTVVLSSVNGSATVAGNDFVAVSETVTFAPGEITQSVLLSILDDSSPEENESFQLVLSGAVNATASTQSALVTILNDDFIMPVINSSLTENTSLGRTFEYRITAANTPSSFEIRNAPAGMLIDPFTGVLSWEPSLLGDFTVELVAANPAGLDVKVLTITVLPNLLADALELAAGSQISSEGRTWIRQVVTSFDGVDAAQAEAVADAESAEFSVEIEGPDRLSFFAKVSSEEGFDFFSVFVDGVEKLSLSGEIDWTEYSVNLSSGSNLVTFQYQKDESVSNGSDTAWLDQFSLASESGLPVIVSSLELLSDTASPFSYVITSLVEEASFSVSGLPAGLSFDGGNTVSGNFANPGEFSFTVTSQANGLSDTSVVQVSVEESFPTLASALELPNYIVSSDGDANWVAVAAAGAIGGSAARSGAIVDGERSVMTLRLQGPGTVNFRWMVSSEERFDFLSYELNGLPQGRISGEENWQDEVISLVPGVNVVRWVYEKDGTVSEGNDQGYVDEVVVGGFARFVVDSGFDQVTVDPADDVDGDGLTLLGEYAFLKDPNQVDGRGLLGVARSTDGSGGFVFDFVGLEENQGVSYLLESSNDLSEEAWLGVNVIPDITLLGAGARYLYEVPVSSVEQGCQFYRVRAVFTEGL